MAGLTSGFNCFFDQDINDGILKGCAEISEVSLGVVKLLNLVKNSSFKTRKGEVKGSVFKMGTGKDEGYRDSLAGVFSISGPPG